MQRKQIKQFFRGRGDSFIPFMPLVNRIAARINQVTPEQMWQDPGILANTLLRSQQLFNLPAITFTLDLTAAGRTAVVTEAVRRAAQLVGQKAAFNIVVTGLLPLATQMGVNSAVENALAAVKSLGEAGVDLVAVDGGDLVFTDIPAFLNPLWNTVRYYDAEPILVVNRTNPILAELASELSGLIIMGAPAEGELAFLAQIRDDNGICLGFPVPLTAFAGNLRALEELLKIFVSTLGPKGIFLVSSGEVPADTPVNQLQEIIGVINRPLI